MFSPCFNMQHNGKLLHQTPWARLVSWSAVQARPCLQSERTRLSWSHLASRWLLFFMLSLAVSLSHDHVEWKNTTAKNRIALFFMLLWLHLPSVFSFSNMTLCILQPPSTTSHNCTPTATATDLGRAEAGHVSRSTGGHEDRGRPLGLWHLILPWDHHDAHVRAETTEAWLKRVETAALDFCVSYI